MTTSFLVQVVPLKDAPVDKGEFYSQKTLRTRLMQLALINDMHYFIRYFMLCLLHAMYSFALHTLLLFQIPFLPRFTCSFYQLPIELLLPKSIFAAVLQMQTAWTEVALAMHWWVPLAEILHISLEGIFTAPFFYICCCRRALSCWEPSIPSIFSISVIYFNLALLRG